MHRLAILCAILLTSWTSNTLAIALNLENTSSVLAAAAVAASGVQQLYNGNQNQTGDVLGKFPYPPYYWWESGGAWGGMVEYFHYTGDESWVNVTQQALISQLGPAYDFNNPDEAFDEGNDDQAFWVFAAMSAAEYSFPSPPPPIPSWLNIVQNAWQDYVTRWNTSTCNGGLKWQFHPENAGYTYKNSVSNGAFFQLSARLARITGDQTYINWANKIWDWCAGVGLIDNIYNIFDGTDETINCSAVDHHQWTYNVGVFLYGAAVLQNFTNSSSPWVERTAGLLDSTNTFLTPFTNATDVMFEAECELDMSCDIDQLSMKAYLIRWLAGTSMMAPFTAGRIGEILRASAQGAAAACTGGMNGTLCGSKWYVNGWDGTTGLGQELAAMEAMYALLVNQTNAPMTLGNVSIQTASLTPSMAATATQNLPSASASARPLFDNAAQGGVKVQNQFRSIFAAIATTFAVY